MIDLPEMTTRIAALPRDERGYRVPWFVHWADGKPDFRIIGMNKVSDAIRFRKCWVCGELMGKNFAFVIGPMCAINRVSAEPPSHVSCAQFSAMACPFLTKPKMKRNEHDLPQEKGDMPGASIRRNPGCCLVWITDAYGLIRSNGGVLFSVGKPSALEWYCEGRKARREEVQHSIDTGLPILREMAEAEGEEAILALDSEYRKAMQLLPA
jgi:hypothetical protein